MAACNRPNAPDADAPRTAARPADVQQQRPAQHPAPPSSQSAPQRLEGCRSRSLELELTPSRAEIILGEPAVLLVSLRNCSNAPVEAPEEIDPDYGLLQVMVTLPGGKTVPYMPLSRLRELRGRSRVTLPLEPGAQRSAAAHSYWNYSPDGPGWLLDSPGTYLFAARLMGGKTVVEAPAAELRVRGARGVSAQALSKIWNVLGPALRISPPSASRAIDESLATLAKPVQYMRPFLRVAAVLARSQQGYDRQADQFVAPECGPLADEGLDIVRSVPDPYFSALAASRLSRCLAQIGKDGDGRKLLGQARASHPRLSRHPEIARLLSEASVSTAK